MLFKEIEPDVSIRCPTKESAEMLMKELQRLGYKWLTGHTPTTFAFWETSREKTVYTIRKSKDLQQGRNGISETFPYVNFLDIVILEPGDVVRIKNNLRTNHSYGGMGFVYGMDDLIGKDVTIKKFEDGFYLLEEDEGEFW